MDPMKEGGHMKEKNWRTNSCQERMMNQNHHQHTWRLKLIVGWANLKVGDWCEGNLLW